MASKFKKQKSKRGLDLSPEEAHRLWSVAIAGKEFGAVAYLYGISNTAVKVDPQASNQNDIMAVNKLRREIVGNFLRSWADNIEGKA